MHFNLSALPEAAIKKLIIHNALFDMQKYKKKWILEGVKRN